MAPFIMFLNGPAYNGFNAHLWGKWGQGYVPGFTVDGVNNGYGWNQAHGRTTVNNRLSVPAVVFHKSCLLGNASGGSVILQRHRRVGPRQQPGPLLCQSWKATIRLLPRYGVLRRSDTGIRTLDLPMRHHRNLHQLHRPVPQTIRCRRATNQPIPA
jgi:hypothetical protein